MFAKAFQLGMAVVTPKQNELFIDIDSPEALEIFKVRVYKLGQLIGMTRWTMSRSKTEGHFHVTAGLNRDINPVERIALQAMLGSDPMHEALSLKAAMSGMIHPTVFFEPPPMVF